MSTEPQQIAPRRHPQIFSRMRAARVTQQGKVGWILLWLLGVPLPILLLFFVLRGCT